MDTEEKTIREQLRDVFVCKICGMPKTHHRLYGYRCSVNPEHDEIENNIIVYNPRRYGKAWMKREIKIKW